MASRRDFIATATLTATGLALAPLAACSQDTPRPLSGEPAKPTGALTAEQPFRGPLLKRAIPASGEQLPVIGMGTSGSFEVGAGTDARAAARGTGALHRRRRDPDRHRAHLLQR